MVKLTSILLEFVFVLWCLKVSLLKLLDLYLNIITFINKLWAVYGLISFEFIISFG